jgi:hypothetical protein
LYSESSRIDSIYTKEMLLSPHPKLVPLRPEDPDEMLPAPTAPQAQ